MRNYRAMALAAILAILPMTRPASALDEAEDGVNGEGYLSAWLVLAPIPLESDQEGSDALAKEQIKEEADLKPEEGEKVEVGGKELTWKGCVAKEGVLDFKEGLGDEAEKAVGYAATYVIVEDDVEKATLKVGSDDQVRVYLNGKQVHSNDEARGLEKDQDTVEGVSLKKGRNILVIKVVNEGEDWAGSVRFVDKDGAPIKGLTATTKPE